MGEFGSKLVAEEDGSGCLEFLFDIVSCRNCCAACCPFATIASNNGLVRGSRSRPVFATLTAQLDVKIPVIMGPASRLYAAYLPVCQNALASWPCTTDVPKTLTTFGSNLSPGFQKGNRKSLLVVYARSGR